MRGLKRPRPGSAHASLGQFTSAGDEPFLSAVKNCLAHLPVRTALEGVIEHVLRSCCANGAVSAVAHRECARECASEGGGVDGCHTRTGAAAGIDAQGACVGVLDDIASNRRECRDSEDGRAKQLSGVASDRRARQGEEERENGPGGEGTGTVMMARAKRSQSCGCKHQLQHPAWVQQPKELVPGVPWPEWRSLSTGKEGLQAPHLESTQATTADTMTAKESTHAPTPQPAARDVVLPQKSCSEYDTLTLWFSPSLTSRQRAMVHQAARELGLGHNSVGQQSHRRVVVWNSPPSVPGLPPSPPLASMPMRSHRTSSPLFPSASVPSTSSSLLGDASGGTIGGCPENDRLLSGITVESSTAALGETVQQSSVHVEATPVAMAMDLDSIIAPDHLKMPSAATTASVTGAETTTGSISGRIGRDSLPVGDERRHNISTATVSPASSEQVGDSGQGHVGNEDAREDDGVGVDDGGKVVAGSGSRGGGGGGGEFRKAESTDAEVAAARSESIRSSATDSTAEGVDVVLNATAPTAQASHSVWNNHGQDERPSNSRPLSSDHPSAANGRHKDSDSICFVVVGAVDGVAEEIVAAPEDSDVWETRRVVVEIKNRMGRARNPPPLYDQIQLVVRSQRVPRFCCLDRVSRKIRITVRSSETSYFGLHGVVDRGGGRSPGCCVNNDTQ